MLDTSVVYASLVGWFVALLLLSLFLVLAESFESVSDVAAQFCIMSSCVIPGLVFSWNDLLADSEIARLLGSSSEPTYLFKHVFYSDVCPGISTFE